MALHRGTADNRDIALDLRKEVREPGERAVDSRLVRKRSLDFDISARRTELDRDRAAGEVGNRGSIQLVRRLSREVNLMIILSDMVLIDENELGDDSTPLETAGRIEIRNISNHQVIGDIKCDRITLINQAC